MLNILTEAEFTAKIQTQTADAQHVSESVRQTLAQVRQGQDQALKELTQRFDQVELKNIRVQKNELDKAYQSWPAEDRYALEQAAENIRNFHQHQLQTGWQTTQKNGNKLGQLVRPIDRVGVYVPGGTAAYPSSVLMNVIPAQLAGVPSIALVSPPQKNGLPHPLVLGACKLLEVDEVYSLGGAQAIAALAYGTETIEAVAKISGPGNAYVAEAKRQVFGVVGIDSIAGPSDLIILHSGLNVDATCVATELAAQAEHGVDSKVFLITDSPKLAAEVQACLAKLVPKMQRGAVVQQALEQQGGVVLVANLQSGIQWVNLAAPEHLQVLVEDATVVEKIQNAGAIFVGAFSTVVLGDYCVGTNHTLPTGRGARFSSALSVVDFQKRISYVECTESGFKALGPIAIRLAELEGLFAHAAAVENKLQQE